MKKIIFLFMFLGMLVGCNDKDKITVDFTCNGIKKEYNVKVGDEFRCSLFAADYRMKILNITDDKFVIESNHPLAMVDEKGSINTGSTELMFDIEKGRIVILAVPLDGLLYTVEFEW